MPNWTYDPAAKRYKKDGNVVAPSMVRDHVEGFIDGASRQSSDLAEMLARRDLTTAKWEREMRSLLNRTYTGAYAAGIGGRHRMTHSDFGRIGYQLRTQYAYLREFARDVAAGKLSVAQAAQRASLYAQGARAMFNRGLGRSFGIDLPAYPGDGGTPCLGNCRCHWDISETESEFRAYWRLGGSRSGPCAGCQTRASLYGPYVVGKVRQ